nr:hypothetical protein Q903MT_gene5897 [Picea sitchensis]
MQVDSHRLEQLNTYSSQLNKKCMLRGGGTASMVGYSASRTSLPFRFISAKDRT